MANIQPMGRPRQANAVFRVAQPSITEVIAHHSSLTIWMIKTICTNIWRSTEGGPMQSSGRPAITMTFFTYQVVLTCTVSTLALAILYTTLQLVTFPAIFLVLQPEFFEGPYFTRNGSPKVSQCSLQGDPNSPPPW